MEIEKKYLVKVCPQLEPFKHKDLTQGYVSTDPVIRIRHQGYNLNETQVDEYYLTMKSSGHIVREEYEMAISKTQFEQLLKKVDGILLSKTRYYIPLEDGLIAELDIYHGRLNGLLTVEVEFSSEEAAHCFIAPDWFGLDVSRDLRYKNNHLISEGIPT